MDIPSITTVAGFSIRLAIAIVLGVLIGTERQLTKHTTGIITNVIVCIGSFSFTAFSYLICDSSVDLTRIAAQVVSGIGFLGAGVILSDGTKVKGVNTAASIWAAASVGILCCLDRFEFAILVTIAILLAHLVIHPVTEILNKNHEYDKEKSSQKETFYEITVICSEDNADEIKTNFVQYCKSLDNVLLRTLKMSDTEDDNKKIKAQVSTKTKNNELIEQIIAHVGKHEKIVETGWKHIND